MIEKLRDNPEIYRILVPLPENPLKYLNSYIIKSKGETLLIDTGFNRPECKTALIEGLKKLDVDFKRLLIFLTHLHSDHTGQINYFTNKGVIPFMNGIDYDCLLNELENGGMQTMSQIYFENGFPQALLAKSQDTIHSIAYSAKVPFPVKRISDNDIIRIGSIELECIAVPGHTPGQTCLYMKDEALLFSADHILFDITPNICIWQHTNSSLKNYLASLSKIESLKIKETYPAHRETGDVYRRIGELKKHHYMRLQEILNRISSTSGITAYDVAKSIHWDMRGKKWDDFSINSRWFAMGETLAHIEWLEQNGYIKRNTTGLLFSVADKIRTV